MKKTARWIVFVAFIVAELFSTHLIIEKNPPDTDTQGMRTYMH